MAENFSQQIASNPSAMPMQTRTQRVIAQQKQKDYQAQSQIEAQKQVELQSRIDALRRDEQARETAYRYWKDRVVPDQVKGQPEYKYLKELYKSNGGYANIEAGIKESKQRRSQLEQEKSTYYSSKNINPSTQSLKDYQKSLIKDFQTANPNDKLYFNSDGSINMIKSEKFGQFLTVSDYNAKAKEYNQQLTANELAQKEKEEKNINDAKNYLKDFNAKVESTKLVEQKNKSFLESLQTEYKSLRVASPIFEVGTNIMTLGVANILFPNLSSVDVSKEDAERLARLREANGGFGVSAKDSRNAVLNQEQKEFRAQTINEIWAEGNKAIENAPTDIKFLVQQGVLDALGNKGIKTGQSAKGDTFSVMDKSLEPSMSIDIFESIRAQELNKNPLKPVFVTNSQTGTANYNPKTKEFSQSKVQIGNIQDRTILQDILAVRTVSKTAFQTFEQAVLITKGITGIKSVAQTFGSGLKMGEISSTGAINLGDLAPKEIGVSGIFYKPQTYSTLIKGGALVGSVGLFAYGTNKRAESYEQKYGKAGKEYANELTIGEITGIGLFLTKELYARYDKEQNAKAINEQNVLKAEQKKEIQYQRDYGQFSDKAKITTQEVGTGKEVFNEKQLKAITKQFRDIYGVDEASASKYIKESTVGQETLQIEDTGIPSRQRLIEAYNTGKLTSGNDIYEVKRFLYSDVWKQGQVQKEIAFEFNLKGSKMSNILFKVTDATDNEAVTSIFAKVRANAEGKNLLLKQVILGRSEITSMDLLDNKYGSTLKIDSSVESRLLSAFSDTEKLSTKDALRMGLDKDYLLKSFSDVWGKSTNIGQAEVSRIISPSVVGGEEMQIIKPDEYIITQSSTGQKNIGIKNIVPDDYFDKLARLGNAQKVSMNQEELKTILGEKVDSFQSEKLPDFSMAGQKNEVLNALSSKSMMTKSTFSSSVSNFLMSSKPIYKELPEVAIKFEGAEAFGFSNALADINAVMSQLQSKSSAKASASSQAQLQDLLSDSQSQLKSQSRSQASASMNAFDVFSDISSPITNISPTFDFTVTQTPKAVFGGFADFFPATKLKKRIKRKYQSVEDFGILPDFTARALGLEGNSVSSQQDLKRLLRQSQTGFEVRTGVAFKMGKGIKFDNKKAMRDLGI